MAAEWSRSYPLLRLRDASATTLCDTPRPRFRTWGTRVSGGGGETFELLEVVDVVAGHGFYDGCEGHGAALGMSGLALAVGFGGGGDEFDVPVAGGLEEDDGGGEVVGGVALAPDGLIEWLDLGMVFAEGLAEAEGEDDFAVCEVSDDFADAPFAGGGRVFDLSFGERREELMEVAGRGCENGERRLAGKEFGVGIQFHGETVSRLMGN